MRIKILIPFLFLSIFSIAQTKVDSLLSEISLQEASRKIEIYEELYELVKRRDPYKAIAYIQDAIQLGSRFEDPVRLSRLYNKCGNIYYHLGDKFLALHSYFQALKYAQELKDDIGIGYSFNDIGNVYYSLGNFEIAKNYYNESVALFENLKDNIGLAVAYNNLGLVAIKEKKFEKALMHFQQGLELRQIYGDVNMLAHSNLFIPQALILLKDYENALKHINVAYNIYMQINRPYDQAKALTLMGETYIAKGDFVLAEEKYLQALKIFEKQESQIRKVIVNLDLALLQLKMENYSKAHEFADITLNLSKKYDLFEFKIEAFKILAKISVLQNKPKEAYNYQLLYDQVKDSMLLVNQNENFLNLQFHIETHQKRIENELLNNQIEKNKLERNYMLVVFLLILLLLVIFVSRFRLKRKKDELIIIQKEEIAQFELQQRKEENVSLNRKLELRNRELTSKTMGIIKNGKFIGEIIDELQKLEVRKENCKKVETIVEKLKNNLKEDSWKEFEIRFAKVYKDFYIKLSSICPILTPNERKLCAFLKLNMTTKEISAITYQSSKSIDVARYRLRKKMNLQREENLINFLSNI
jgi:tetratricopeptide (TPR) repeat protein